MIRGLGEAIAEPTAGVDDGLASFLGCGNASARDNLRRAYGSDVWAVQILESVFKVSRTRRSYSALYVPSSRKGGIKSAGATRVVGSASTLGLGAALAAVPGNAIVAGRVQNGDSRHTKLHVPRRTNVNHKYHEVWLGIDLLIALSYLIRL